MIRKILTTLVCVVLGAGAVGAGTLELFDHRRMLTASEHAQWRAVGRVNVKSMSERGMCTGTLISEDLVLTAAHCLVSRRTGRIYNPSEIHFVAGWRQGTHVAHSIAADFAMHPDYGKPDLSGIDQVRTDLALIRLRRPIPSDKVRAFRIAPAPSRETPLTLISYRQDRAHALTRQEGCDVRGADSGVLALGCDVTFGASGSPLFAEIDGERRLIAVISAMSKAEGQAIAWAVRVDAAMPEVLAALP